MIKGPTKIGVVFNIHTNLGFYFLELDDNEIFNIDLFIKQTYI